MSIKPTSIEIEESRSSVPVQELKPGEFAVVVDSYGNQREVVAMGSLGNRLFLVGGADYWSNVEDLPFKVRRLEKGTRIIITV